MFEQLVHKERLEQDRKWGEQNHEPVYWLVILLEEIGELSRAIQEMGQHLEDAKYAETELVQVAAVAKAMWESGKRNGWL